MSRLALEEILARALEDERFRDLLLRSPAEALAGYDLSEEERGALIAGNLKDVLRSVSRAVTEGHGETGGAAPAGTG